MADNETPDMLHGVAAIGRHLGLTKAAAQHRIDRGLIPTFRLGGSICARRSSLNAWLAEREAEAEAERKACANKPPTEDD